MDVHRGMNKAMTPFEAAIVEHCVVAVKAGREMSADLVQEAMRAVIQRQYALLDNPAAMRQICDVCYDNIRATDGAPTKRVIDDATIAAAPVEARALLAKHRTVR